METTAIQSNNINETPGNGEFVVTPYSKNAKKHPKKQIEQVANSIKEFGMNQPIVVDKQGVIIVGHGRFEACKHLGWSNEEIMKHVRVVDLTENQAKAYRLADNKLNESDYELCIVGKKGNPEISNRFGLDYQDIWRLQREMGRNKDHATAKPIELIEKPIKHASKEDDIVMDLFLGSGSTLIASQKTGRICYGMELDPKYVDVIVQRYVDYTDNENIVLNGQQIIWKKTSK